jgi:hypothetical protein
MSAHVHDYGDSDDRYAPCILCGITRAELDCTLPTDVREFLIDILKPDPTCVRIFAQREEAKRLLEAYT